MRIFTFLFILLSTSLFGQKNYPNYGLKTLVYQLTDEEAKEILIEKEFGTYFDLKESYLEYLVDSLDFDEKPNLPIGHYLLAKAVRDEVVFELFSQNSISAISLNNERDFQLQVVDSLGKLIENAKITLNKKTVPFDKNTKTYRLKKWNKEGFLTIKTEKETVFFEVTREKDGSIFFRKLGRLYRSKVGRIVSLPVRIPIGIGKNIFYYFKRGFGWRDWSIQWWRRFGNKNKDFRGYIAFNKPKYQPKDTVKIKAYVTNHKGKPFKKALVFKLNERYNKNIFEKELQPISPGNFVYEFVVGDSLKLDKRYLVYFEHPKKENRSLSHQFYYEDYQLDKLTFSLRSEKEEYLKNDKIILFAEGKDKNDLTIPDGEIRLTLTRKSVQDFLEDEMLIPDTLWQHEQLLDPREETQIIVPDSIFPAVNMTVSAQAWLMNSNGETQVKNIDFKVSQEVGKLSMKIENGEFIAEYLEGGKSVQKEGIMEKEIIDGEGLSITKRINLPYKERLNPFINNYLLEIGDQKENLNLYNVYKPISAGLNIQTKRTADSIFINFTNPNHLPVNYLIRTKNTEIANNFSDSTNISWKMASRSNEVFYLKYNYVWGGETQFEEEEIRTYKKLLNIKIDQSQTVNPGETIPIKIKVEDYKNRPAKNVNLTAGALNAQFENTDNLLQPQITYKNKRSPFYYNKFFLKNPKKKIDKKSISKKWAKKLALDTLL